MPDRPLTIAVDAMGGDLGPAEVVRGVERMIADSVRSIRYLLVGDEAILRSCMGSLTNHSSVSIKHASQTIEMTDKPREVYRRKPDASVVVSARLVKEGLADAFVSIGHTGAAMAASLFAFRTIAGVDRPAICTQLPTYSGKTVVLLDAGANVDCTAPQLRQFAVMGSTYSRVVLGVSNPKVGLLSNGEEPTKGNALTIAAHALLRDTVSGFHGNVEGRGVFEGEVDVVVCDGFNGNILLKTGEGVAEMVLKLMREELTRHAWMKLLLAPIRPHLRRLAHRIDYREFGGAPLLGVNGVCIVGHGRSDARAIAKAISVAEQSVRCGLIESITTDMASIPVCATPPESGYVSNTVLEKANPI